MKKRFLCLVAIFLINLFSFGTYNSIVGASGEKVTASLNKSSYYAGQQLKLTVGYDCGYIVAGSIIEVVFPQGLEYKEFLKAGQTPIDSVNRSNNKLTILQSEGELKKTDLVILTFEIGDSMSIGSNNSINITLKSTTDDSWNEYSPNAKVSVSFDIVAEPTPTPTATPTQKPTATPTQKPTATPTQKPTATPTQKPTATPTQKPTATPTQKPTKTPNVTPTITPTNITVVTPTNTITNTLTPTNTPYIPNLTVPENWLTFEKENQKFAIGYVDGSSFSGEPVFTVTEITDFDGESADLILETVNSNSNGYSCLAIYKMWLAVDDLAYIPEKVIGITFSSVDSLNNYEEYVVLYINDSLETTELECSLDDGVFSFNNSNAGYFALMGKDSPKVPERTNDISVITPIPQDDKGVSPGTLIILIIVTAFISLWIGIGIGFIIWGKNSKKTRYSSQETGGWYR